MIFKPASKRYSLMKLFNLFMSLTLCSVYFKENREFPILPSTKKKKKKNGKHNTFITRCCFYFPH